MGRIVVNKHVKNKDEITPLKFVNEGEIVISNESGREGIAIVNTNGEIVFVGQQKNNNNNHYFLSDIEYQELIENGKVETEDGVIVYDDTAFYAIYDSSEIEDDIRFSGDIETIKEIGYNSTSFKLTILGSKKGTKWYSAIDNNWITINPQSSTSFKTTIDISITENDSNEVREGTIRFYMEGLNKVLSYKVYQGIKNV